VFDSCHIKVLLGQTEEVGMKKGMVLEFGTYTFLPLTRRELVVLLAAF